MTDQILTRRLRLQALSQEALRAWEQHDRSHMEALLGLERSDMHISEEMQKEIDQALPQWIKGVSQHPGRYAWYTNWEIILQATNTPVGTVGFSGFPDQEGDVFMGYLIDERHHMNGYMTEAAQAMVAWAFAEPACQRLLAETPKDNLPSQGVLRKLDFRLKEERKETYVWELERGGRQQRTL